MATYNSDVIANKQSSSVHGEAKTFQSKFATAALATATAGDIINLIMLPAYARLTGMVLSADQLDTGGGLTINVGDGGYTGGFNGTTVALNASRYFAAATVGRAATGNVANVTNTPILTALNFLNNQPMSLVIYATIAASATAFVAGNLYLRIDYVVTEPLSLINSGTVF